MGGNFVKNDFASSEKGSTLKGKKGRKANSFLFRYDSFSEAPCFTV